MFEFKLIHRETGNVSLELHDTDIWRPTHEYIILAINRVPPNATLVHPNIPNGVIIEDIVHQVGTRNFKWTEENRVKGDAIATQVEKPKKEMNLSKIKIGDLFKYPPLNKYTGLGGKLDIRAPTTFVGVEIELENVVLKTNPPNTCRKTDDGSLKIKGAEFITIPIQFKYLEVELDRLFGSLDKPLVSSRCSVHVHLNARDFTLDELKTFVALYMVFERSLYRLSGDRWNNIFCVPLQMYLEPVTKFFSYMNKFYNIPKEKYSWFKYYGLNLSPLFGGESSCIGTIEFRQKAGSVSTESIINWINLIVSLKLYAKKISSKEFLAKIEDMNTSSTYYGLAEDVFGSWADKVLKLPTFKDDVEGGITSAKKVFLATKECKEEIHYNFRKGN